MRVGGHPHRTVRRRHRTLLLAGCGLRALQCGQAGAMRVAAGVEALVSVQAGCQYAKMRQELVATVCCRSPTIGETNAHGNSPACQPACLPTYLPTCLPCTSASSDLHARRCRRLFRDQAAPLVLPQIPPNLPVTLPVGQRRLISNRTITQLHPRQTITCKSFHSFPLYSLVQSFLITFRLLLYRSELLCLWYCILHPVE
jgi:hypothetical protein